MPGAASKNDKKKLPVSQGAQAMLVIPSSTLLVALDHSLATALCVQREEVREMDDEDVV